MIAKHGVYTVDGKPVGRHTTRVMLTEDDAIAIDLLNVLRSAVIEHGGTPEAITFVSLEGRLDWDESKRDRVWKLELRGEWK